MTGLGAVEFVDRVLDPGSWLPWDEPPGRDPGAHPRGGIDPDYAEALRRARRRSGLDESVVTGEGRVRGRRVAVVACEFRFLAGSIGGVAARRLVGAVERATAERLPLLASPASGGTRMQEGTVAFVGMVAISAAVARHRAAGLPYLVYLRHPTTGGAFASWGSLGHVTAAEPGALVGFLGPKVYQALHGEPFPAGVQVAENLVEHGIVDVVVAPGDLPAALARILCVLCGHDRSAPDPPGPPDLPDLPSLAATPAWDSVTRSRRPARPALRDLLRHAATDVTALSGTGAGEAGHGMLLALARFAGVPCVVVGHDRRPGGTGPALGPDGLRVARRGMRLAAELDLPVLTVVDTAGAALAREAEEGGLAGEIARCLAELVALPAPTLCLLLGQGAGGAALALLPTDRVIAAQHAWLSPLPPEGASAILHGDPDHGAELAARQGVRAVDLRRDGIVDLVVPEAPDAADAPGPFLDRLGQILAADLAALLRRAPTDRAADRLRRYRGLGVT